MDVVVEAVVVEAMVVDVAHFPRLVDLVVGHAMDQDLALHQEFDHLAHHLQYYWRPLQAHSQCLNAMDQ